jgi:hypothetical protein
MSRRSRLALLFIGLLVIGCSLAALVYAFGPVELERVQATLAPTLFTSP